MQRSISARRKWSREMFYKYRKSWHFILKIRLMTVRLMKYTYIRFSVLSRVILGRLILHFAPTPFQK